MKTRDEVTAEVILHDNINLIVLFIISAIDIYYLWISTVWADIGTDHLADEQHSHTVSKILTGVFLTYLIFDTVWIIVIPKCVLKKPTEIVYHHLATISLVLIPIYSKQFEWHSAISISVELSTIIMIFRRKFRRGTISYTIVNIVFYVLFFFYRIVFFPSLVIFYGMEYIRYSKSIGTWFNPIVIASPLFAVLTFLGFCWVKDILTKIYHSGLKLL